MLLTALRCQADTYAYGFPPVFQNYYNRLKQKQNERFGHVAMKEELHYRIKAATQTALGIFSMDRLMKTSSEVQILTIHKLNRSMRSKLSLLNSDSQRTRPKTLQAVTNAMQEECLRMAEKELVWEKINTNTDIYLLL